LIGITPTVKIITSFPVVLTLLTVILFSMSSWAALQGSRNAALDIMKVGFLIMVIFAVVIIITIPTRDIIQTFFFPPSNQTITNREKSNLKAKILVMILNRILT
jgi:hypothetical protein